MDIRKTFLQQSYIDNWELFKRSLDPTNSNPYWDIFVITASNEEQANAYRIQIDHRKKNRTLPPHTNFIVIADPDGKRVGSGGATLNALLEIHNSISPSSSNPFYNKRIVMIHSGGDSKRIPQYSAFGKLFSKVPRELPDGRYSTLFDEFLISLSGLPSRMKDGVLIVSGDALLLLNHNQIDLGRQGAVGISMKAPAEVGSRHGVYLAGKHAKVDRFLHKMPVDVLSEKGAVNEQGQVNIDTGLIWMDSDLSYSLVKLLITDSKTDHLKYDKYINDTLRLNFYGDFLIPMTTDAVLDEYLKEECEGIYCDELLEVRRCVEASPAACHREWESSTTCI